MGNNLNDLDWDALLQSTASEAFDIEYNRLSLGDLAQGIARTSSMEAGLLRGDSSIPSEFRNVNLGDVLNSFANASPQKQHKDPDGMTQHAKAELNVAQMVDSWVRDQTAAGPPVVVSGVPLGAGVPSTRVPNQTSSAQKKKPRIGYRQVTKKDERSVKNRKSAAKSRKKRAEYTKELEERAKLLKDTNSQLRKKIVDTAKAPPASPGSLEGKRLRKTRTLPTNFRV
jgi:hypothetical protein